MNPLDALSALTQFQAQTPAMTFTPGASAPGTSLGEAFHLQPPAATQATQAAPITSLSSASPSTWGHMVQQMVLDVNAKQQVAGQKITDVLKGGATPVHEAVIASEEASLSFEFLAQMRNKVVESYQQIMQMQV